MESASSQCINHPDFVTSPVWWGSLRQQCGDYGGAGSQSEWGGELWWWCRVWGEWCCARRRPPCWLRQPALQDWACRCNPQRRPAEVAVVVWGANIHLYSCHRQEWFCSQLSAGTASCALKPFEILRASYPMSNLCSPPDRLCVLRDLL